jgi:Saf4/Yju2 protein
MAERKVLIKYYPPNFDPERLIKNKRPKDKQDNVRMMLPNSLRCSTCGNYLYIGTKFNMRKETCLDEDYLGIRIYRFYLKCTQCYAEITFKTDPKNSDYVVEHGGVRNYEPWRDVQAAEQTLKEMKETEEEGNAMKFLENRTYDSKREMDILDALDEIKHLNKKKSGITYEDLLKLVENAEEVGDERKSQEMAGRTEEEKNELIENAKTMEEEFKKRKREREEEDEEEEEIERKKRVILVRNRCNIKDQVEKEEKRQKIAVKVVKKEEITKEEGMKKKLLNYSDDED